MTTHTPEYNPKDFTLENYASLLQLAKKRFKFVNYENAFDSNHFILWRHDIDASVHRALSLAKIENENNIKATYFLYLHSLFYNVLEAEITQIIREIISMGHEIGLHFDCNYYEIKNEKDLELYLGREKRILEELFSCPIDVVSFHNPTTNTQAFSQWKYSNMINAYADYFKTEIAYCSDSNGYWRFRHLKDVLLDLSVNRLQVLTHPEWWSMQPISPREKISLCINGRADSNNRFYDKILRDNGRLNIR